MAGCCHGRRGRTPFSERRARRRRASPPSLPRGGGGEATCGEVSSPPVRAGGAGREGPLAGGGAPGGGSQVAPGLPHLASPSTPLSRIAVTQPPAASADAALPTPVTVTRGHPGRSPLARRRAVPCPSAAAGWRGTGNSSGRAPFAGRARATGARGAGGHPRPRPAAGARPR